MLLQDVKSHDVKADLVPRHVACPRMQQCHFFFWIVFLDLGCQFYSRHKNMHYKFSALVSYSKAHTKANRSSTDNDRSLSFSNQVLVFLQSLDPVCFRLGGQSSRFGNGCASSVQEVLKFDAGAKLWDMSVKLNVVLVDSRDTGLDHFAYLVIASKQVVVWNKEFSLEPSFDAGTWKGKHEIEMALGFNKYETMRARSLFEPAQGESQYCGYVSGWCFIMIKEVTHLPAHEAPIDTIFFFSGA